MHCHMTRGIYLRANGELDCYCSTGEQVTLGHLDSLGEDGDFVRDIYRGRRFEYVRNSMSREMLPFMRQCAKCNYLSPLAEHDPEETDRMIDWVHMESSALCNLRCPFCVHGLPEDKRPSRPKPHFLPRDMYLRMLDSIVDAGLGIRWMYFSGRGEPTLHPEVWKMVQDAKRRFDTNFLVNTNGNARFDPLIVDSGLDKIKLALDSLDQETYARYRIGGKVENGLKLTDGIASYKARKGVENPTIIWQKVLFDFNSSPEEIHEYQKMAQEHGVDRIRLFFTWTTGYSTHSPDDYDLFFPDIEIHNPYKRGIVPLEQMKEEVDLGIQEKSIPQLVNVINKYMHWIEHGIDDRVDYNRFALMQLSSPELMGMRKDEEDNDARRELFATALDALADLYSERNMTAQSKAYSGIAKKVAL